MAGNSLGKGRNGTPYFSHRSGKAETLFKAEVTMDAISILPTSPKSISFVIGYSDHANITTMHASDYTVLRIADSSPQHPGC